MKKPLNSFLILISLLFLSGCDNEKSMPERCNGPSGMTTAESCYKPAMGLVVSATGYQSVTDFFEFRWHVYPQTDANTIDLSASNEKYAIPSGYSVAIPGEYINETSRFVLKADMLCDGLETGSIQYIFNLEDSQVGCKVWVGSKL